MTSGWGLVALLAVLGCDEPRPKASQVAPRATASPTTSVPPPVGDSVKIDRPPAPVAEEKRLRQQVRGKSLVLESTGSWSRDCLIHRPCKVTPQPLELCAPERDAEPWATLASKAERLTDPNVSIKGRLVMSDHFFSTAVGCQQTQCCNQLRANVVLAGPPYDLELVGLTCSGDESRQCCALSARGEEVIATGRLRYVTGRLLLESPNLCRTKTD